MVEMMTARVCCSLIAVLLCLFVYLSTTDAKEYVTAKPGVCPIFSLDGAVLKPCLKLCFLDRNCPDDEKCCSNGCGRQCMPPYKEKPGVCPKIYPEDDMLEDCAELCSQDGQCPDDEKCCSNGCGQRCMPPYKGIHIAIMV
uniref:WAP domain-containing protein n=1 Tax=Cyprinus carpio TaxID=7962 RepID=A0A8C2EHV9_CYPCA